MLSRRNAMFAASGFIAIALAPRLSFAEAATATTSAAVGPFILEPLPYPTDALEPFIDARTMELHHDRHHAAYVSNLNTIAKDYPQIVDMPPVDLLERLAELPDSIRTGVRNNLGGHANHTMFWTVMKAGGGKPSGELAAAIDRDLGGMEMLTSDFNEAGGRVFGSGWVFVTVAPDGKLAIETRPNQDSPLMDGNAFCFGTTSGSTPTTLTTRTAAPTTSRHGGTWRIGPKSAIVTLPPGLGHWHSDWWNQVITDEDQIGIFIRCFVPGERRMSIKQNG